MAKIFDLGTQVEVLRSDGTSTFYDKTDSEGNFILEVRVIPPFLELIYNGSLVEQFMGCSSIDNLNAVTLRDLAEEINTIIRGSTAGTPGGVNGIGVDKSIARWNGTTNIEGSDWFIDDNGVLFPLTDPQDIGKFGTNRVGNIYMGSRVDYASELILSNLLTEKFKFSSTGVFTINQAYSLPSADGGANEVLTTDGAGNVTFQPASSGGVSLVVDNYANINALRIAGTLTQGGLYFVSDRNWLLQAVDSSNLSLQGSLVARNADYQNAGDYSSVTETQNEGIWENTWNVPYSGAAGVLPFTLGEKVIDTTTLGVGILIADSGTDFTIANVVGTFGSTNTITGFVSQGVHTATIGAATQTTSYAANKIVIWNNQHWENQTGNHGANTPDLDGVNWTLLDPETSGNGYITEVDFVEVDFPNDWLQRRTDKRDNDISYSKATDDFFGGLYGTTAVDFFKWGSNTSVANKVEAGILDNRNTLGEISDCQLELLSRMTNIYLDSTSEIFGMEMFISSQIDNVVLVSNSDIRLTVMLSGAAIQNVYCSSGNISVCEIKNNIGLSNKAFVGADIVSCVIGLSMAAQQTITQTISDKRSEKGFSNFEETVASASSIDLTALDLGYAGIITLTGNTTVDDLTISENHPTTFKATNGNSITFTHTDLGSATATSIALRQQSDLTIVGRANESDYIVIEQSGVNRNKEVYHVILEADIQARLLEATLTLSDTQLNNLNSSPQEIIPSPSAGKAIQVISAAYKYTFAAVFTGTTSLELITEGTAQVDKYQAVCSIAHTKDVRGPFSMVHQVALGVDENVIGNGIGSGALTAFAPAPGPAGGAGSSITITVQYIIIDV